MLETEECSVLSLLCSGFVLGSAREFTYLLFLLNFSVLITLHNALNLTEKTLLL